MVVAAVRIGRAANGERPVRVVGAPVRQHRDCSRGIGCGRNGVAMLGLGRETVDVAAVRDAVGAVQDPELQRSLGELDMVRAVTARRGRVEVELALTTAGCPMTELLTRDVTSAASAVTRTDDVHISFTVMTESERRALAERFLAGRTDVGASAASSVFAVASG